MISTMPSMLFAAISPWIRPLWMVWGGGALVVVALLLLYVVLNQLVPKIAAIAQTTAKEAVSQPLFYVLLAWALLLILSLFLPYYTFGEDVKVVEDNGLTPDHDPGDHLGPVDGQRFHCRGDRRPHGPDRAVQADRPPRVHPGQVPGHPGSRGDLFLSCWARLSWPAFRSRWCTTPGSGLARRRFG